jgi:pilus assembly protein CpaE
MLSFNEVEGLKDKVKIVVNRVGLETGVISLKKAQETMGREIFWQLPNDYRTMVEVRNNGVPLTEQAPRAGISQAIASLVETLTSENRKPDVPGDQPPDLRPGAARQGALHPLRTVHPLLRGDLG